MLKFIYHAMYMVIMHKILNNNSVFIIIIQKIVYSYKKG